MAFADLGRGVTELMTLGIVIAVFFLILAQLVANTTISSNVYARTAINNISSAINTNVTGNFNLLMTVVIYAVILMLVGGIALVGAQMWAGRSGRGQ